MKYYISALLIIIGFPIVAQLKPQYTQYVINPFIINPACAGIENYHDVKLSYRQQWVGIKDAPATSYLTISSPLGKSDLKSNATTLYGTANEDNKNKRLKDQYSRSKAHHGIGLQIINDQYGPFSNLSVKGVYAYHLGLTPKLTMSLGVGAGVNKTSLDIDKLFFGSTAPADPAIFYTSQMQKYNMDVDAGVWLYSKKFFGGISLLQLVPQNIDFSNNYVASSKSNFAPRYFATAGYKLKLNSEFDFIPSIMLKSVSPMPVQLDFNGKVSYQDFIWIGLSYRSLYGVAAMAGINIFNTITVAYSYDYSTTQINTISSGSHEIVVGFALSDKRKKKECRN